jgi:hypothetical protein
MTGNDENPICYSRFEPKISSFDLPKTLLTKFSFLFSIGGCTNSFFPWLDSLYDFKSWVRNGSTKLSWLSSFCCKPTNFILSRRQFESWLYSRNVASCCHCTDIGISYCIRVHSRYIRGFLCSISALLPKIALLLDAPQLLMLLIWKFAYSEPKLFLLIIFHNCTSSLLIIKIYTYFFLSHHVWGDCTNWVVIA